MLKSYKSHKYLRPYYFSALLSELYFIIPIWLFFYLRIINYQQAATLTIVQAITSVVLEIPTGAFADIYGKRITLIISFFVWAITNFLYIFSNSFLFFVGLEIAKGFAKAMYSGTFEAIVYDTMIDKKTVKEYPNIISDFTTLSWVGLFVSAYSGGFLYELNVYLPYILTSMVYLLIGFIFIFRIKEPKADSEKFSISIKEYLKQNTKGFGELFKTKLIAFYSLLLIVISLGYYVASEFLGLSQARDYGITPSGVGLLFGSGYIISALFSQLYPKLSKTYSRRILVGMCTLILAASFIFANWVGVFAGGVLILLRISSSTIFINLKSSLLNSYISSRNRSTALSSMNLFVTLPYSIILTFGGGIIDRTSPNYFAFIWGLVFVLMLAILGLFRTYIKRLSY